MLRRMFLALLNTAFILVSLSIVLAQENTLPAPTGPHKVGIISLKLIDTTREEVFTEDASDQRVVNVWVWYPADPAADATLAPYMNMNGFDFKASGLSDLVRVFLGGGYPEKLKWLNAQQRHAFESAPAAKGEDAFPVIIYSNILSGLPFNQSMQFEELASHGYIVLDVIHTYGFAPDLSNFPTLKIGSASIKYDLFQENTSADIQFVLDQLDSLNSGDIANPLTGRFNMEQIGGVGYSSGGWPIINTANEDSRIKAGISQDGAEPSMYWNGIQPFMFMTGGIVDPNLQRDYDNAHGPVYLFKADGFRHGSFGDYGLWPLANRTADMLGSVNGVRTVEILRAYVLAFFDKYLKGEDSGLLDGPSTLYPEVEISTRNID